MRAARLKLTAVVAAGLLGLAGTGTLIALAQAPGQPTETPDPARTATGDAGVGPGERGWLPASITEDVASAFPRLTPPDVTDADLRAGEDAVRAKLATACPRLFGGAGLTVEPNDPPPVRLVKARIHQCRLELRAAVGSTREGLVRVNHRDPLILGLRRPHHPAGHSLSVALHVLRSRLLPDHRPAICCSCDR